MRKSIARATVLHARQIDAVLEAAAAAVVVQEEAAAAAEAAAAEVAAVRAKQVAAAAAVNSKVVAGAAVAGEMVEGEAYARLFPRDGVTVFRLWHSCRSAAPAAPGEAELRHIRLVMAQVACGGEG